MRKKTNKAEEPAVSTTTDQQILERKVIAGIIIGNALHAVRDIVAGYKWTDKLSGMLYESVIALDRKNEYISTFTVREKAIHLFGQDAPGMDEIANYFPNPASLIQLAHKMTQK